MIGEPVRLTQTEYNRMVCETLHRYCDLRYEKNKDVFERSPQNTTRPPVFASGSANLQVLVDPKYSQSNEQRLLGMLPRTKRHRWFGSMKSSQALAQSVFGNLVVSDRLSLLSALRTDDGQMLFGRVGQVARSCELESTMCGNPLCEVVPTEVDVFFRGAHRIAVECKFTEVGIGACTIPKRKSDECDGNLHGRSVSQDRCYLQGRGIKYWEYVSDLFTWDYDQDSYPCPLQFPYQLVRNVLAACIREDGVLTSDQGHAVLVFDNRNPSFQPGGRGDRAWQACKDALKLPHLLQRCSWQEILGCICGESELSWLTDELKLKYGL